MLTGAEISGHEFASAAFGGYHKGDVDEFIETVAKDYGELIKKNQVLEQKLRVLVQKIEEYRQTEDNMRASLLTAQKRGEEIVENSEKLSQQLLSETDIEIKRRHSDTENSIRLEEERIRRLHSETKDFTSRSLRLIDEYRGFLQNIDNLKLDVPPQSPEKKAEPAAQQIVSPEPVDDYVPAAEKEEKVDPFAFGQTKNFDYENLKFGYNYSSDNDDE